jgi:hypothetical protein
MRSCFLIVGSELYVSLLSSKETAAWTKHSSSVAKHAISNDSLRLSAKEDILPPPGPGISPC